jgi:hypothetical protein
LKENKHEELSIGVRNEDKNWPLRYYRVCFHFEPTEENVEDGFKKEKFNQFVENNLYLP